MASLLTLLRMLLHLLRQLLQCLNDVFNKKAPDIHRAQALYQIFIETASELETTSHFTAVMTRIAENLSELGEHVLTRPSSPPILPPIPSSPVKRNLIDSSSSKQMKRKHFKSTKKRKVNDIDTAQTLAKRFGSEPEMDSDGLFPNPIYGYKDAIDEFMNEDSIDDSFMLDREIRAFDRDYPFADQSYEIPQVSIPAAPTPVTSAAPLPLSSLLTTTATLPLPKMDLPRARTEPLPSKPAQTALPSRAQTALPEVSKNTLTARRCTNKDASPSSFVKFMDVPVTMTREHIHGCLKNNRRWSTVDISNVEIFAIRNKDSTVVNILKIKFKDDAQSTTAKRCLTLQTSNKHRTNNGNIVQQQRQGNNDDNIYVTSLDNISVNNGQSP
ncbi:hypothetical protein JOM56_000108 [Amanita muscaria]